MNANGLKRLFNSNGRRRLFFSVGGVILVAVILTAVLVRRAGRTARTGLYTVNKGTLRIVVTEEGALAAKESEKIIAEVQAQAKIVWIIDEGSFVTEGTKLIELDKTRLEELLESLQTDLISLEVDYTQAQEDVRKYNNAEYPQQLKELKFNVVKAKSRLEKAQEQQPKPEHVEQGLYSKGELRDAQLAVQEAQMNVETADLALEVFEKYTHPRNELDLKSNLDRVQRIYERQKEQEAEVTEQLKKMEMHAPSDGLVIYGSGSHDMYRRSRDTDIEVGADVYKGQVLITLPNVSKMQAAIKIHEMDFLKIKKDLPATITVHALHQTFTGKVSAIGALAHERDGWRTQGVKVFDVAIDIEGAYTDLRPGMMARVDLLVDEITDVLLVPVEAVFAEPAKDEHFCWVRTPAGPQKRPVKLGASSNSFAVVTEGLKEGEQVYQYDPTAKGD